MATENHLELLFDDVLAWNKMTICEMISAKICLPSNANEHLQKDPTKIHH